MYIAAENAGIAVFRVIPLFVFFVVAIFFSKYNILSKALQKILCGKSFESRDAFRDILPEPSSEDTFGCCSCRYD